MFKEGEKYKCKKTVNSEITKGKYYIIDAEIGNLGFIINNNGLYTIFNISSKNSTKTVLNFSDYFYTKKEERKLKLKKLNDVK